MRRGVEGLLFVSVLAAGVCLALWVGLRPVRYVPAAVVVPAPTASRPALLPAPAPPSQTAAPGPQARPGAASAPARAARPPAVRPAPPLAPAHDPEWLRDVEDFRRRLGDAFASFHPLPAEELEESAAEPPEEPSRNR